MLHDSLKIALEQLRSGKLRSTLTILGITIGIATVIAIVSVLEGYFASISSDLNVLGANTFQVQKWDNFSGIQVGHNRSQHRKDLTRDLAEAIRENCTLVDKAAAEEWQFGEYLVYRDKRTNPNIMVAGAEPDFFANNGFFIDGGRALTWEDIKNRTYNIVLGTDVIEKLFPFENPLGKTVKVAGLKFTVVGTLEKLGSGVFGGSKDNNAVIPITTFQNVWGKERSVNITVSVKQEASFDEAKDQVIGVLRKERKVAPGADNDFAIFSNDTLVDTFTGIADKIEGVAALLGIVSLLVGSIGVMNIMLVTVTERTREIGIRKAVGAKQSAILVQFIIESILLSLFGGFLGMALGFGLALIVNLTLKIPFVVPIWMVVVSVLVTSLVGLLAGLYPAAKGARMDPINALRYE